MRRRDYIAGWTLVAGVAALGIWDSLRHDGLSLGDALAFTGSAGYASYLVQQRRIDQADRDRKSDDPTTRPDD